MHVSALTPTTRRLRTNINPTKRTGANRSKGQVIIIIYEKIYVYPRMRLCSAAFQTDTRARLIPPSRNSAESGNGSRLGERA